MGTPSFFASSVRVATRSKLLKRKNQIDLPKQPTPVPKRMLRRGEPKHAATAVRAFPSLANEISATKSPMEFAHARNVNPIIAVGIFQNTPKAVKSPTISFASHAIQSIAVIIPKAV